MAGSGCARARGAGWSWTRVRRWLACVAAVLALCAAGLGVASPAHAVGSFTSVWNTSATSTGSSAFNQVHLPLQSTGTYNFTVDWGDSTSDTINVWNQAATTHTYAAAGYHTITITGTIIGWMFAYGGDRLKLWDISNWGPLRVGTDGSYFHGASNMTVSATDALDLTGTTNLSNMFASATAFNGDISGWNTASVTDMYGMFQNATWFNGDISGWNTASVTNMSFMFYGASAFNQDIGNWNTASVTNMSGVFYSASAFNQDISGWNTAGVTNMSAMFYGASAFNQDISGWSTASVTNMSYMFYSATAFNQDISGWNTASVTNMSYMFYGASAFNQDISGWNTAGVTNMSAMFYGASAFNQDISGWNTARVANMYAMFSGASAFNQDISGWNTASATNMAEMFYGATGFNQGLGGWNTASVTTMSSMFSGVTLSVANYDSLLIGWSQLALRSNVTFSGGSSRYSTGAAATARASLINDFSWTITDGGQVPAPTLTSITPGSGPAAGGTPVTLTGTILTGATSVTFGGVAAASFAIDSATQITATTPVGTAGAANVAVTTPGGTATLASAFTYTAPPAALTQTPIGGCAKTAGRVRSGAWRQVTTAGCATNAGQRVAVKASAAFACLVGRKRAKPIAAGYGNGWYTCQQGSLQLRGPKKRKKGRNSFLTISWYAPAIGNYAPYAQSGNYRL